MAETQKSRLVELLIDLCLYGDVDETPWPPEMLAPTWEKMTTIEQTEWFNGMDEEQRVRTSIAASIRALVYGGKGGSILTAGRDEELGLLLKQAGSQPPT
jgi:hypothetical protein